MYNPLEIKHGLLEHPPFSSMIFQTRNLELVEGFPTTLDDTGGCTCGRPMVSRLEHFGLGHSKRLHRQETPCDHFWMLGLYWQVALWGRVWLSDDSRGILQIYLFLSLVRTREVRNFVSHWFLNFFPQTKSGNHQFLEIPVSIYTYICIYR